MSQGWSVTVVSFAPSPSAFNFGCLQPLMVGMTFLVFVAAGGELTPQRVFTTLSLLSQLRRTSGAYLVRSFFLLNEASVALQRIQVPLISLPPLSPSPPSLSLPPPSPLPQKKVTFCVSSLTGSK